LRHEGYFANNRGMARTDQPHKLTFNAFVASVTDYTNPLNEKHRGLDYGRPETRAAWNGAKSKIPIWCNEHREFFTQLAANHRSLGQGCPKCGKQTYKDKRRHSDPVALFRDVHGDAYDYSQVRYVNNHTPVAILCSAHGLFEQKPAAHLRGAGCPECWKRRKMAFAKDRTADYRLTFAQRAAKVHDGRYALLTVPTDSHDIVRLHCPKHGDFEQKAYSHLLGHGCPACGKITSYAQRDLAAFVEALGVAVEHDNRTVLGGLHIDVWCPEQRVGIEYHGSFWHTQSRVGNKHREKWERAVAAGVRLIQVFDYEWLERRSAVENRLRAIIGGSPAVAARKCDVRPVSVADANAFCKTYHTQGAGLRHKAAYGLYSAGELVGCMTFGSSRYSIEGWELLRFATKGRVQGGFGRLLAAFFREHGPDVITSYCDLRWGTGDVYAANGFVLDGVTAPDYWYVAKDRRVSRYAAQNRPKGQTEREWAEGHGYEKVLGVGHQRWVWKRP